MRAKIKFFGEARCLVAAALLLWLPATAPPPELTFGTENGDSARIRTVCLVVGREEPLRLAQEEPGRNAAKEDRKKEEKTAEKIALKDPVAI